MKRLSIYLAVLLPLVSPALEPSPPKTPSLETDPPSAATGNGPTSTLFYQPSLLADPGRRFSAWSHSIVFANGRFVNAVAVQEFIDRPTDMGLAIVESDDGVHWRETSPFACPLPRALAGYCLRWDGEAFVYYVTERNAGPDRKECPTVVCQHRSADLQNWASMGDEFTTRPEKQWYRCRWDELVILDDGGTFYGHITSEPRPELAQDSMGMLVQLETLGLTRTGVFEFRPEPAFDVDEFSLAAFGNVQRGGPYLGLSRFAEEDIIGPIGYAVPCGIRSATPHRFRLLIKNGIWELYLDDRYVQTYITGPATGRLGLFAKSGTVEFRDLRIHAMTPDSRAQPAPQTANPQRRATP